MLNQHQIKSIIQNYPSGTRVELSYMDGEIDMPQGLKGSVWF